MKWFKTLFCGVLMALTAVALPTTGLAADSCTLAYGWKAGQAWQVELLSQTESSYMGNPSVQKNRQQISYRIKKSTKAGWVHVEARIRNKQMVAEGGMDISRLLYEADMHQSGQLKNVKYTGSLMPNDDAGPMAEMMAQSYDMMAKAMQQAVFWFPELPEDRLEIGDEFESVQKTDMAMPGMMNMQTVTKTVFTLEDIDRGLAYFSAHQRSASKITGMSSGKIKTAGKADAIFDLQQGMWVELTSKNRSSSNFGDVGGSVESISINKYQMERN
jgi:hypothetical protein